MRCQKRLVLLTLHHAQLFYVSGKQFCQTHNCRKFICRKKKSFLSIVKKRILRRSQIDGWEEEGAILARAAKKAIWARFLFHQFCSGSPTRSHVSRGERRMSSTGIFFLSLRPRIQLGILSHFWALKLLVP